MTLRALRPHHWAKNLLLLLPAVAAHLAPTLEVAGELALAFVSFSLLASAGYLVNDVADAAGDRLHPTKRGRPVADGTMRSGVALAVAAGLALVSLLLALRLPDEFLWAWAAYLVMTAAYSGGLKAVVVLDVVLLAAFYTVRVVAGAAAVDVPLSRWFLAFSVFVFLSLALLKRASESVRARSEGAEVLPGRGWRAEDLPVLLAFGAASAGAGALVYCLYITSEDVIALYARPDLLWLGLPVILYWLARAWLLALRGEVHEDPLVFALTDAASWMSLAVFALAVWLAA